jgi:transposase
VPHLDFGSVVAPFVIDGPMSGTIFLAYVKQCLAPTLDRRDVVIMDNLPAHKVAGVTDAIEAVGATGILSATVFT